MDLENDGAKRSDGAEEAEEPAREPVFNITGITVAIIGLNVGIHLVRTYLLTREQDIEVLVRFAFIPARYGGGDLGGLYGLVSAFTYSLLHGDFAHLGVNMIWLAAFGSPLAARIGAVRFVLFWIVTAMAAAALHYALYADDLAPLVGASGAVSGMMGAAARFGFRTGRARGARAFDGPVLPLRAVVASRLTVSFLAIWFVANLIVGLGVLSSPGDAPIAWQAHIGGFIAGFVLIRFLDPPRRSVRGHAGS